MHIRLFGCSPAWWIIVGSAAVALAFGTDWAWYWQGLFCGGVGIFTPSNLSLLEIRRRAVTREIHDVHGCLDPDCFDPVHRAKFRRQP